MERVLILGSKGMLGGQLLQRFPGALGWDREDIDVLDFPALRDKVRSLDHTPETIINCIAFNDVDGAEDNPAPAFALNGDFVGKLAQFARELDIPLVHYSTNYVFDGMKGEYTEHDTPSPLSVYGRSKLQGEQLALESGARCYVIRTAVLFGPKGSSELSKKSFVDIMLDLSAKRDTIQAVSDETNSITFAPDLALRTRALLETLPPPGVFHITNSGSASWCDFAKEILHIAERNVTVVPVPSTHFPRKALRPAKAVLLNTKLPPVRAWQPALADFLSNNL